MTSACKCWEEEDKLYQMVQKKNNVTLSECIMFFHGFFISMIALHFFFLLLVLEMIQIGTQSMFKSEMEIQIIYIFMIEDFFSSTSFYSFYPFFFRFFFIESVSSFIIYFVPVLLNNLKIDIIFYSKKKMNAQTDKFKQVTKGCYSY